MRIKKPNSRMLAFILAVLFCFTIMLPGEQAEKKPHPIPQVKAKVKVDAIMDEAVWKKALKFELDYEVRPGENIKPPVKTEVYFAYSTSTLYVAFRAYDPDPKAIRADMTDRDSFPGNDYVAIILDTFNDSQRTYNFFCNPFGVQADMIESPEGGNAQWDAIWDSAGKVTDWGFCVEMAIPFSSLRFQAGKKDQIWRVDAVRKYPRSVVHHIGLFPRDRNNNCYMCQAEQLIGFSGTSRQKNLEITPTISGLYSQKLDSYPYGEFIKDDSSIEPGITARWSFTPNLTLSATANPDFSNVEADVAQLNLNKQFALYYSEKRPFFLEGASIFRTRYRVVHTRSLVDPDGGIKLTGKEGRNAIGFFSVYDNVTNLLIPGSQNSYNTALNINTLGSVVRYRRDVGKASNIGVILTDREGTDYFNRVGGIDGNLRLSAKDRVMFQFLGSQTHYPGAVVSTFGQPDGNFSGAAIDVFYRHATRNFMGYINYQDIGADFRGDLGFLPQVDYRNINGGLSYTWQRPPGHWFTVINLGGSYQLEKDHDGNLLYNSATLQFQYAGPVQSYLVFNGNFGKRAYLGKEFEENYILINTGFQPSGSLDFSLIVKAGDEIDLTNVQPGTTLTIAPSLTLKFGSHLRFIMAHAYEKLTVEGGRLYTANLTDARVVYQINKRIHLRAVGQYAHNKFNTALYPFAVNPKFQHLFSQFLFSYKINPQTVLYLGYSDNYYGYQGILLTQTNRTAFIKIGYALRL